MTNNYKANFLYEGRYIRLSFSRGAGWKWDLSDFSMLLRAMKSGGGAGANSAELMDDYFTERAMKSLQLYSSDQLSG